MPILRICERHSRICGTIEQCCVPKDIITHLMEVMEYEIMKCQLCDSEERARNRVHRLKEIYQNQKTLSEQTTVKETEYQRLFKENRAWMDANRKEHQK